MRIWDGDGMVWAVSGKKLTRGGWRLCREQREPWEALPSPAPDGARHTAGLIPKHLVIKPQTVLTSSLKYSWYCEFMFLR